MCDVGNESATTDAMFEFLIKIIKIKSYNIKSYR